VDARPEPRRHRHERGQRLRRPVAGMPEQLGRKRAPVPTLKVTACPDNKPVSRLLALDLDEVTGRLSVGAAD
jgi:hypothetical protein